MLNFNMMIITSTNDNDPSPLQSEAGVRIPSLIFQHEYANAMEICTRHQCDTMCLKTDPAVPVEGETADMAFFPADRRM